MNITYTCEKHLLSFCTIKLFYKILTLISYTISFIHTHTHTKAFKGLFSTTTWVGQYQKDKPFWILLKQEMMGFFAKARDDGIAVASAEPYANH